MIQQTNRKPYIVAGILASLILVALIFFVFFHKSDKDDKETAGPPTTEEWEELKQEHQYIEDVIYKGPFEDMSVYDYPFQKTQNYLKNKELEIDKAQFIEETNNAINDIFTANYSNIVSDPGTYVDTAYSHLPYGMIYIDAGYYKTDEPMTAEQLTENLADYIVDNEAVVEAKFTTNESLVYQDGLYWCRGILKTTAHTAEGEPTTTEDMVDVEMMYGGRDKGFLLSGIYLAKNFSMKEKEYKLTETH